MKLPLILCASLALAGCTLSSGQQSAVTMAGTAAVSAASSLVSPQTAAAGQAFCAKATADGPLVVALVSATANPQAILVTGLTSAAVAAACQAWAPTAVPVVPPAVAVPAVAVVVPAA